MDGLGKVIDIDRVSNDAAWTFTFEAPPTVAKLIVEKGSIAVNGISLTVATCEPNGQRFSVAVIPHSFKLTNLNQLETGRFVNLETDVLGKYVDRLLNVTPPHSDRTNIDLEFLMEHGYP